jgi:uncharacterized protein involved in oxidation of intracellular sulfur
MNILIIINDPPYGTEKAYNALRLAMALQKETHDLRLRVFLLADSIGSALSGQSTPNGYYNLERMLRGVIRHGGEVSLCGTCIDARGLTEANFVDGATHGTMSQLAQWTANADKVIVF